MKKILFLLILILFSCGPKRDLTLKIEKIGSLQNEFNNEKIKMYAPDKSGYQVIARVKIILTDPFIFGCGAVATKVLLKQILKL